ncbi:MAG: LuxR C-terminal-related transcriptional regulator [Nitrospiraceae bacterium]
MLSMYTNEEYLKEALPAGAAGYLPKDADRTEFELAIKTVCRGWDPPGAGAREVYGRRLLPGRCRSCRSSKAKLTARQREILQLVAEGCSTKQIASTIDQRVVKQWKRIVPKSWTP